MKFLCDNCKAKYQIADEKVSGRTVRMKCRKCGHLIEIRASVTESSVPKAAPVEESVPEAAPVAAVAEKKSPAAAPAASAGAAPRRAPAPGPSAGKAPGATPLRVAGSTPKPAAAKAGGGLASAFNKSVKEESDTNDESQATKMYDPRSAEARALDMSSPASTEEWYVGVNGVPVGPVRLAELRAKAAAGGVTEESLVWREGFEEWLPLKTFPDLVSIVRQAQGVDRLSHTPPPGSVKPSSVSSPATSARGASQRSNVISFSNRNATAEKLEEQPAAQMSDPFALPIAAVPAPGDPPRREDDPGVVAIPPPGRMPSEYPLPRRASGGIPVAAWIAIVLAMATGVVAGSVFFSKPPPPPTVQIVTVSAPIQVGPAPTVSNSAGAIEILPDPSSSAGKAAGSRVAAAGSLPAAGKSADPAVPVVGNVPSMPGIPMPGMLPGPGGPSPSGVADKLTSDDLQRVVATGRNALKRACWEPALAAKSANAPNSAHVSVAITIGPDGRVQSAVPSGGDAFPTLGSCIASRIRNWTFPQASGTTSTAAAFNFVSQ